MKKYNEIWDKISNLLIKQFNSMPVHYNKYSKTKNNIYNKKTDTNFYGIRISENDKCCACLSIISLDSIGR